jgi:peroxiredoxin
MSIVTGQPAPDFTLFTDEMNPFTLSEHQGAPVLLLFFPGAFTSVCTTELNTVNNNRADFGESVQIAGISTDSPFVLSEFSSVNDLQFPLLSDHDAEVSAQYGAKYDRDFTDMQLDRIAKRAAFVVDGGGIVRYAEVLDNAGKQPDFEAIQEVLDELE